MNRLWKPLFPTVYQQNDSSVSIESDTEEAGKQRLAYAAKKTAIASFLFTLRTSIAALVRIRISPRRRSCCHLRGLAAPWIVGNSPRFFVSPEELVHANFSGFVSFFGQAADDFHVVLPRPSVVKNPLFHVFRKHHRSQLQRTDRGKHRNTLRYNTRKEQTFLRSAP